MINTLTQVDAAHPISFDHVTKRYGRRTVLDDLTFAVPRGAVVGLLGPNGAGKSTAMRVLLGLQRPDSGVARIAGRAPGEPGFRAAVRKVGAIIEAPPLYKNISAHDNLAIRAAALGVTASRGELIALLGRVGLASRVDDRVARFSLGMRQRVGIALALVGSPSIAVLDEPTNGLDPEGSVDIRHLVKRLPEEGTTTLICTHRLDEIEKTCDYVVVLRDGRLVTEGSLAEVTAKAGQHGHVVQVAPEQRERAVEVLSGMDLGRVRVSDGDITTERQADDPARITYALGMQGIYLRGLQTTHASLEDAFLELTRTPQA